MATNANSSVVQRDGWTLLLADSGTLAPELREEVIAIALQAAAGTAGQRVRRSLHAETWLAKVGGTAGRDLFVKIIHPHRGLAALKQRLRGSPAAHVAAISASLRRYGFTAPSPMLRGSEAASGREIIVAARVAGVLLPRLLREKRLGAQGNRAMLRALGMEVARLHRAGYIHGDLTPFNIVVSDESAARFVFLDNERTRKTWFARLTRPRLRNLVQLGHFDLPGLTRAGKMRVWCGYADAYGPPRERAWLRRVARMIQKRRGRDRRKAQAHSQRIVAHGEVGET
ncbi:MAG TPA: lipopolysaccharide kinase InaA family protein [Candidatus Binataceae bacterium]|nr:lipopolysaccharide kinase InaA family protein [Candidatus Binataceae bacterium]